MNCSWCWVQVHELTNALTLARSDLVAAEGEVSRLKELHSQVKAALQESYSTQQQQQKQVRLEGVGHAACGRVGCCCGWAGRDSILQLNCCQMQARCTLSHLLMILVPAVVAADMLGTYLLR
jgi:hypothetical protein